MDECNRCGACCERGGECALRSQHKLSQWFIGRCELLTPTHCEALASMDENERAKWIDGFCDFLSEIRRG